MKGVVQGELHSGTKIISIVKFGAKTTTKINLLYEVCATVHVVPLNCTFRGKALHFYMHTCSSLILNSELFLWVF